MIFITDYRRLNQKFIIKMYPLTITVENIQQLEGLQYATELDINMGYYTIRIFTASKDTTTIVTEFEKFRYNCLTTGMCALGDIFQEKVYGLLGDIKGVKTYMTI